MKKVTALQLEEDLLDRYTRWKDIYENGCTDRLWEDGTNINLVRNHIIYYKKQCEEFFKDKLHLYPDLYFYPLPEKLPYDFMAKSREVSGKILTSTKEQTYNEVVKFKWCEVM